MLTAPKLADGFLVVGAAGQVVATDPLDRHDPALGDRSGVASSALGPIGDGPAGRIRAGVSAGPHVGAGVGLGVEAAVERILVLGEAAPRTSRTPPSSSSGRSYGTPRTIVKRGPQLVQLMNG